MEERHWLASTARRREREIIDSLPSDIDDLAQRIEALATRNRVIHEVESLNLNPASNVMNPRAEALQATTLGTRASLGHAGEKYEMGLEAVEQIEVMTAALACRVFGARFAEVRVGSGALANLYAFMATCKPGDAVIVPPASVGGHVTHNREGAAGLYGVDIHEAPIDPDHYTIDVDGLAALAERVRPKLITMGASLNLLPHPVREVRAVADSVGAALLFDAAHACGMFAGKQWSNPLDEGADLMTMSTYKSLGGPAGGLVLTNRPDLAERLDSIAYPGLTANFDVGRVAALGVTLTDWLGDNGEAYAAAMVAAAHALAVALAERGLPVYGSAFGYTRSHQLAVVADRWGGGHEAALRLRRANLLTCAIGLPAASGLRLGTPEAVRWGVTAEHMPTVAALVADALEGDPDEVGRRTSEFRRGFSTMQFVTSAPQIPASLAGQAT